MIPGRTTPGIRMFSGIVCPKARISQPGLSRSDPSRKPMYQSGWAPALTWEGLNGPYTHTGLICARPPNAATTPNTRKKNPPPCLLYTSDAADEEDSVDLGGRRIIKKK